MPKFMSRLRNITLTRCTGTILLQAHGHRGVYKSDSWVTATAIGGLDRDHTILANSTVQWNLGEFKIRSHFFPVVNGSADYTAQRCLGSVRIELVSDSCAGPCICSDAMSSFQDSERDWNGVRQKVVNRAVNDISVDDREFVISHPIADISSAIDGVLDQD